MASNTNSTGVGLTLLRVLPVLGTTASLMWATAELTFLSSLTSPHVLPPPSHPANSKKPPKGSYEDIKRRATAKADVKGGQTPDEMREDMDNLLPRFFETYFNRSVWVGLLFNAVTCGSLGLNLLGPGKTAVNKSAALWYYGGFCGVLVQWCFVPFVAERVQRIIEWRAAGEHLDG